VANTDRLLLFQIIVKKLFLNSIYHKKNDITLQHIAKMSLCCEVISSVRL